MNDRLPYGKLSCLRQFDHNGPCSPMHFKVFSLEMQLRHAFGAKTGAYEDLSQSDEGQKQ